MSEKKVVEDFIAWVKEAHPNWKVQTEIPVGEMRADGRIVEVDEHGIIKDVVCYFEAKGEDVDLKELLTGLSQAQYLREQTLREAWLILRSPLAQRLLNAKKKGIGGIVIFDVDKKEPIGYETLKEHMEKSRLKRATETTLSTWSKTFTIETISPIAITAPMFNGNDVMFNLGQRVRGAIKEIAKTISGTLSQSVKYSIYVEPLEVVIAKKADLSLITEYIPTAQGSSSKREMYEIPKGKRLTFTVRCTGKRLTPLLIEDLIRQAGLFCGLGDSHSDGYHGRYNILPEETS
jgi:hypothetical protein